MMWHGDGWSGGHWLATGAAMLLLWALVIAGAIWAVHTVSARRRPVAARIAAPGSTPGSAPRSAPAPAAARRLLDERFARGEIDAAEYRARRDALDGAR